jgi:DNA-binding beta-propeller fold protein YncE
MITRTTYFLVLGCLLAANRGEPSWADSPASLLVSEFGSGEDPGNRILKYSAETGEFLGVLVAGDSGLKGPGGMLVHPLRRTLLVTSLLTNNVQEFDMDSGERIGVFGGDVLRRPTTLRIHPTRGTLLVVGRDNRAVLEFNLTTGNFLGKFASCGGIEHAFGIDFDLDRGTMLLGNYSHRGGSIEEFDLETGEFIRTFTREIVEPTGVLVHPVTGNVLADTNHSILEFSAASGRLLGTFASHPDLDFPGDIAWNPVLKDIFVISRGDQQKIYCFDGMTGEFEKIFVPTGSGGLRGPSGLLVAGEPPGRAMIAAGSSGDRTKSIKSQRVRPRPRVCRKVPRRVRPSTCNTQRWNRCRMCRRPH